MKPDLWMPLYVGDYLKDTLGLPRAEHGSYLLLIMAYWSQQKPLIDDDIILREIARCPEPEWPRTRKIMLRFFTVRNGEWHHKRIDAEIEKSLAICATKSKAGKAGADKRWHKDSSGIAPANGTGIADALAKGMPEQWQNDAPSPSPSPSPSPLQSPSPIKSDKASDKVASKLSDEQKRWAERMEEALGEQWVNDAGKWIRRIKSNLEKTHRVICEVRDAKREGRIKTTPAQYAEQIWKEFK